MEAAKASACQILLGSSCSQSPVNVVLVDFDANKNEQTNDGIGIVGAEPWDYATNCGPYVTSGDNLATFCLCQYNINNANECKKFCGCP